MLKTQLPKLNESASETDRQIYAYLCELQDELNSNLSALSKNKKTSVNTLNRVQSKAKLKRN